MAVFAASPIVSPVVPPHAKLDQHRALATANTKQIWNLKNADIRAVINTIAALTGKNFIIDPRVSGKVTLVSKRPMTVKELYQVFLSLLSVLNYTAVPAGTNTVKIVPSTLAAYSNNMLANKYHPGVGAQVVIRVVPIKHVSAEQLVPVLRPLLPQWGSVTAYNPSNSLIMVGSAANINKLVAIVHRMDSNRANSVAVVSLHYANAQKLVQVLTQLQVAARAQGKVSNVAIAADSENNSILVSGSLSAQVMMRQLIQRMDTKNATGSDDTVVVRLNYLDAKKMAPLLRKIAMGSDAQKAGKKSSIHDVESAQKISVQAAVASNALILHAPALIIKSMLRVIHKLDVRPQQVLVQAIIVKVNQSVLNRLGIIWGTQTNSSVDANGNVIQGNFTNNQASVKVAPGFGFIHGMSLQALVNALKNHSSTDVLATPSILVLNNEQASIADGKNIGIINRTYSAGVSNSSQNSANTAVPFNTFQRTNVTLSLKVTPTISPNNTLRLKIKQKDDSVDQVASSNPDNPVLDTSQITTSVLVHSGSILVLGGLINNNLTRGYNKVPILGDLPLIGHLFRFRQHSLEKQNLMVFIRPIIVNSQLEAHRQTLKRYQFMRHQEINSRVEEPIADHNMPILPALGKLHLLSLPRP